MPNIVMATNTKAMGKLDGSVKPRVYDFLEKLQADDTTPGLHIEPLKGALDARVRTGRVDINHRAILFRIDPKGGDTTYIYMGTWKHDEANALAEKSSLRVNPITGTLEGIIGELNGEADRKKRTTVPDPRGRIGKAVVTPEKSYLERLDFTLTDLTEGLGLDPALAQRALAAADETAINELAAEAEASGSWQGHALFDLALGISIDDIREKYSLTENPVDTSLDEDSQIIEALSHPVSKMQFTYVGDDTGELRRVIEGGDFAAWRIFLHPEQRTYAEKDYSGAFRLSGGAGTGKTVVAIHRARNLWSRNPEARIILTTFNKTLAMDLKAHLKLLEPSITLAKKPGDPGVYVEGIDKLANDILSGAGDLGAASDAFLGSGRAYTSSRTANTEPVWREAVDTAHSGLDQQLATPGFLENEYVSVVLGNQVTTLEGYAKVARAGRGVRLSRPQRIAVWKIIDAFRRRGRTDDSLTFPEVQALAAAYLRQRAADGVFAADHVIVDEAQDLHATHWSLLRSLVREGENDLFIAEDSHQRIYGQPVVLRRLGINIVGRSRRLTLNYRTTAQNLQFAVRILDRGQYSDLEEQKESTTGYRSARSGPEPVQLQANSALDELDRVAAQIKGWLAEEIEPSTVAVLVRVAKDRDRYVRALGERGVDARALDANPATIGHVQVMTMHRSKGMEFSRVILAGIDEAHVPAKVALNAVPEEEQPEALLRERSLLYVAASRARDALMVTWSGKKTELLD
ncbi:3'-5' exonuclease [Nocardia seriolae]|uniref:3'-5' exonuclease n=1 Tax=Nocardia seriolae TaxID=37332 RepID=UPI00051A2C44|nr:3'-5' exonuclease [Nocardia seriolae]MTJ62183.1 AAA family ATPase [Nocardia seriolae]MTJ74642.1 AAA family ATPase [Nocardia seriolae]MTJ87094.1 AAA family ATPase [Nocardia seriolae]MTK31088.1 AAA family ATPase [Nocardia seriolae]MTK40132.1 AAA family ATPase [Nocardia seriolae]